jgi:S1-C subfamily serine protease
MGHSTYASFGVDRANCFTLANFDMSHLSLCSSRWRRRCFAAALTLSVFGFLPREIEAANPPPIVVKANELESLTMGDLVLRIDNEGLLGSIDELYRVAFIEQLRREGFPALGAEDLVFKKDESEKARFVIGGILDEVACQSEGGMTNCRVGVVWRLLDRATNAVTYEVRSRYVERSITSASDKSWVKRALQGVFHALLVRPKFVAALKRTAASPSAETVSFPPAHVKTCGIEPQPMPAGAEQAIAGTILVEGDQVFGSGVLLSEDGYALTAAHVVTGESKLTAKLRDGSTRSVRVLRTAPKRDVALLKLEGAPTPCLTVATGQALVGSELYAIGAPEFKELSFSMSRGIVSGMRDWKGDPLIQTDASVNAGHSGGPLIDSEGRIVAITLAKIAGLGIEGVAFGAPIGNALEILGLSQGDTSDSIEPFAPPPTSKPVTVKDTPDPVESLSLTPAQSEAKSRSLPPYVTALFWGGLGVATLGSSFVIASAASYSDRTTYEDFKQLRSKNDIGWVLVGIGAASITTSIVLIAQRPTGNRSAPTAARNKAYELSLGVGVASAQARLDF